MSFLHKRIQQHGVVRFCLFGAALFSFVLLSGCLVGDAPSNLLVIATPEIVQATMLPTPTAASTPEPTPESTPTPEPTPEAVTGGLLGDRFADKFSYDGVIEEPWGYRSDKVSFTVQVVEDRDLFNKKIRYYVVDIYVQDITSLRTGFSRKQYGAKRQDMVPLARSYNALVAMSGVYYLYQTNGGIVVQDGVTYREAADSKDDLCVLYRDGTVATYDLGTYDIDSIAQAGELWQAWSFGPTLIDRGERRSGWTMAIANEQAPRAAFGYYEPGHYCLVLCEGRVERAKGLTLDEWAQLMELLGCETAYNLDGGDTAQLYWQDMRLNATYRDRDTWDIIYIGEPLG